MARPVPVGEVPDQVVARAAAPVAPVAERPAVAAAEHAQHGHADLEGGERGLAVAVADGGAAGSGDAAAPVRGGELGGEIPSLDTDALTHGAKGPPGATTRLWLRVAASPLSSVTVRRTV